MPERRFPPPWSVEERPSRRGVVHNHERAGRIPPSRLHPQYALKGDERQNPDTPNELQGRAMTNPLEWKYLAQAGLLVSTIAGAGIGIVIGYQSGNGWLGTFTWTLFSAVILGGAFYVDRITW